MNLKPLEDLKAKYLKEAYDIAESGGFDKLGAQEREIVQGHGSQIVLIGTIEKQALRIAALEAALVAIEQRVDDTAILFIIQDVLYRAPKAAEDNP